MGRLVVILNSLNFRLPHSEYRLPQVLVRFSLKFALHVHSWQVISPVDVKGFIEVVDELEHVQDKVYDRPTILVSGRVKGEEEIPDGAVAVLTPDMPDVLSHVSVRARNGKVCCRSIPSHDLFFHLICLPRTNSHP